MFVCIHEKALKKHLSNQRSLIEIQCLLKLLEKVGFSEVRAEDRTQQFVNVLFTEKARLASTRDEFLKVFKTLSKYSLRQSFSGKF